MSDSTPQSSGSNYNVFQAQLSKIGGLSDCLLLIRERWPIGLALGLLLGGLIIFNEARKPKIYSATARLKVELREDRILNIPNVNVSRGPAYTMQLEMDSNLKMLSSRKFLDYVVESLTDREKQLITKGYRTPENPNPSVKGIIRGANRIGREKQSIVFDFTFIHRDPEAAAFLANRFTERFIDYSRDQNQNSNDSALEFLREQSIDLQKQMEDARYELQAYRRKHNLVSLEENQNIVVERLKTLSAALTSAKVELLDLSASLKTLEAARQEGKDLSTVQLIAEYGTVPQILSELETLRTQSEILSRRYLERHPKMIDNARQTESLKKLLSENIKSAIADLQNRYSEAVNRQKNLEGELAEAEREAFELDKRSVEYDVLRQNFRSKEALFAEVSRRLNETTVSSQIESKDLSIVDDAVPSYGPISPNIKRATTLAIVVFILAFTGTPILLEFFSHRIKSHWDIEIFLKQRLIADVPKVRQMRSKEKLPFDVINQQSDELNECFRTAYGVITLNSQFDFPKVILITSAEASEGKTFVASELGLSFSQHNLRTLIFDCDFRRPSIHRNFSLQSTPGFLTAWNSVSDPQDIDAMMASMQEYMVEVAPNLCILPTGGSTRDATQIFSDPRFSKVIYQLKSSFDCVFLDTSPAGIFPDSVSLARHAEEAIFVVQHERTNRHHAKHAIDNLVDSKIQVLGTVMNGVARTKLHRYNPASYGYYSYQKQRKYYSDPSGSESKTNA